MVLNVCLNPGNSAAGQRHRLLFIDQCAPAPQSSPIPFTAFPQTCGTSRVSSLVGKKETAQAKRSGQRGLRNDEKPNNILEALLHAAADSVGL